MHFSLYHWDKKQKIIHRCMEVHKLKIHCIICNYLQVAFFYFVYYL